jgi:hypothetical protein
MNFEKATQAALCALSVAIFRPATISSSKRAIVSAWDFRASADTVAVRNGAEQYMQYTNAAVCLIHDAQYCMGSWDVACHGMQSMPQSSHTIVVAKLKLKLRSCVGGVGRSRRYTLTLAVSS